MNIGTAACDLCDNTMGSVTFENRAVSQLDATVEIIKGLKQQQKSINPKYFYDQRGSELFEQITQTEEYYPTRTERLLLTQYATEIADYCGENSVLLEPGSGSCEKVRLLLDKVCPSLYVPMDISSDFLYQAAMQLADEYPWLNIRAICSDFSGDTFLPEIATSERKMVFYPGSTIGNMTPKEAIFFLAGIKRGLSKNDLILLGVDLLKDKKLLDAAYNDSANITADFNLNILNHVNRITGSDFNQETFQHHAFFNESTGRIEMHLVSRESQEVSIAGQKLGFSSGESIHTENSYKYSLSGISQLASSAGLTKVKSWVDEDHLFSVNLLKVL